jgi:predicted transcriptional regulator
VLEPAELRDAKDQPAMIPGFGEKVLLLLYTDPDVADQNDTFADSVKAADLDHSHFQSVGIANMEDAPAKPNWIIRAIVRGKIKKYNTSILTDPKRLLIHAWDLGDCNNKSVVLIVGKDKKLAYFKKGALAADETKKVLDLLKKLISEAGGTVAASP